MYHCFLIFFFQFINSVHFFSRWFRVQIFITQHRYQIGRKKNGKNSEDSFFRIKLKMQINVLLFLENIISESWKLFETVVFIVSNQYFFKDRFLTTLYSQHDDLIKRKPENFNHSKFFPLEILGLYIFMLNQH